jgi:hypothetical protein
VTASTVASSGGFGQGWMLVLLGLAAVFGFGALVITRRRRDVHAL